MERLERTYEDRYTDLLRHIANPSLVNSEELIGSLREVEHMHSMGHITAWQLKRARDAYAKTIERDPEQAPTTGPGALNRA